MKSDADGHGGPDPARPLASHRGGRDQSSGGWGQDPEKSQSPEAGSPQGPGPHRPRRGRSSPRGSDKDKGPDRKTDQRTEGQEGRRALCGAGAVWRRNAACPGLSSRFPELGANAVWTPRSVPARAPQNSRARGILGRGVGTDKIGCGRGCTGSPYLARPAVARRDGEERARGSSSLAARPPAQRLCAPRQPARPAAFNRRPPRPRPVPGPPPSGSPASRRSPRLPPRPASPAPVLRRAGARSCPPRGADTRALPPGDGAGGPAAPSAPRSPCVPESSRPGHGSRKVPEPREAGPAREGARVFLSPCESRGLSHREEKMGGRSEEDGAPSCFLQMTFNAANSPHTHPPSPDPSH
ncbi:translation initiation factor IF-2-like [Phyllostomus hastatus]|uniref:translation initiation factor IF-2-like n=1 Tax=Phyllostomus hastatus TaxID=9423 RepID=UPI001E682088|nr:translation initiation factor IF-2-like [Phyllostomus hastatus]